MTEVTEFVIDRGTWLVGQTLDRYEHGSRLLATNGRQCCLGIYLMVCGMPAAELRDVGGPIGLSELRRDTVPPWLFDGDPLRHSAVTMQLIYDNDLGPVSFKERERRIAAGFATQGITVTFTGDYPEWVKERLNGNT